MSDYFYSLHFIFAKYCMLTVDYMGPSIYAQGWCDEDNQ